MYPVLTVEPFENRSLMLFWNTNARIRNINFHIHLPAHHSYMDFFPPSGVYFTALSRILNRASVVHFRSWAADTVSGQSTVTAIFFCSAFSRIPAQRRRKVVCIINRGKIRIAHHVNRSIRIELCGVDSHLIHFFHCFGRLGITCFSQQRLL